MNIKCLIKLLGVNKVTDLEKNNYIEAVHEYIIENLPLSKLSDEELQSQIVPHCLMK